MHGKLTVLEAVKFVKTKPTSYLNLSGRRLVDSALVVIVGHLLLAQAADCDAKRRVARRFIELQLPILKMKCEQIPGTISARSRSSKRWRGRYQHWNRRPRWP